MPSTRETKDEEDKMILAKFEKTIQVSQDEWRVVWIERLFKNDTPIGEVTDWARINGIALKEPVGYVQKIAHDALLISEPSNEEDKK